MQVLRQVAAVRPRDPALPERAYADATDDLLPHAVPAAVAVEHSCAIIALDRDGARFPHHLLPG